MKVDIIVLAAGSSKRMGSPKQLLKVGETTLLGTILKTVVQSKANNVTCVLGANASLITPSISKFEIEIVINPNYSNGLGTSISKGVSHLKDRDIDGVIILLGDQPFISSNYINKLVTTFSEEPHHIISTKYANKNGVPALFPKKYFNQLLLLNKDKGAQDILNNSLDFIKTLELVPNLKDIDTPTDYQNLTKTYL